MSGPAHEASNPGPSDSDRSAALTVLIHEHNAKVLAYIERHMPDELRRLMDPQDIQQDVYVSAFRRVGEFAPAGSEAGYRWLVTIARNQIIDALRAAKTLKRAGTASLPGAEVAGQESMVLLLQDLAVYERTPSRSAVARELLVALETSIGRMPDDYRQAIRLRYVEGIAVKEVASRMGRTEGAISMLCGRALKALRLEMRSISLFM